MRSSERAARIVAWAVVNGLLMGPTWLSASVADGPGGQALLFIDRHLLHEGSAAAFKRFEKRGVRVRRPDLSFATADHYVLTSPGSPAPRRLSRMSGVSPMACVMSW